MINIFWLVISTTQLLSCVPWALFIPLGFSPELVSPSLQALEEVAALICDWRDFNPVPRALKTCSSTRPTRSLLYENREHYPVTIYKNQITVR